MQDQTIKYKVKVFISSKIDSRYKIVRKALEELLLQTNMTIVFTFETSGASGQDVVSSYMNSLDDSDLCIFIIDNLDGVPNPVLAEQRRAQKLNKRSIYIFCDENNKNPTQMQNELQVGLREKYVIVHEFSDIAKVAYTSVIRDIVDIYRINPRGQIICEENEPSKQLYMQKYDTYKMDKNLFKAYDATKNELVQIVNPLRKETKDTSELDELCRRFLSIVIGKSFLDKLNLDLIKNKVCSIHEEFMRKYIEFRYNAIIAYYNNKLDDCLNQLELAYNEATTNKQIPNWISNDIAIDMRNVQHLVDQINCQHTIDSKGQKLLNENDESVFFPLLDRFEINYKDELIKKHFSFNTDSPYSINIGGLDSIFNSIASCFYIAVMFGSLTHVLITRNRLIEALSTLCVIYQDHDLYIELIKMLLMERKDKELEKIIRSYNQTTDMINDKDVEVLLQGINCEPISHRKIMSLCLLFKYFGYYFNDKQYNGETEILLNYFSKWALDNKRIFDMAAYIFDMLQKNIYRLDIYKVIEFILSVFDNNLRIWYDKALKVLSNIDYSEVSENYQNKVSSRIILIISDESIRNNCHGLTSAIIYLRKNFTINTDSLDECVELNMPNFYKNDYSLEIFNNADNNRLDYIKRFINIIHEQNEEQGKNGTYYGYDGDIYNTIRNIIEIDEINLKWNDIETILTVVKETLIAPQQGIESKNNAIKLIIYLKNKFPENIEWDSFSQDILNRQEEILCGSELGFLDKDTISLLQFNYLLLKICFCKYTFQEVMSGFTAAAQMTDYEAILSLQFIETLLFNANFATINTNVIIVIMQYVSMMSGHKIMEARFFAIKCLTALTYSEYKQPALEQLSKMMDNGTCEIKTSILCRVKKIDDKNRSVIDYIIQKGKVDNNYLVRKLAIDNE